MYLMSYMLGKYIFKSSKNSASVAGRACWGVMGLWRWDYASQALEELGGAGAGSTAVGVSKALIGEWN